MELVLAIGIGAAFGAVLDRIGATNPNVIGRMLNLTDLRLMKAILLAIGTGSALMFAGQMLGIVDVGHMSVKAAYWGVVLGGMLLGFGWAFAGYCPGTGIGAAASGRIDAMIFVLGGLLGAAAYMVTFEAVDGSGILAKIFGGAVTLGQVPGSEYAGLTGMRGDIVGLVLGVVFIAVAFMLPERLPARQRA